MRNININVESLIESMTPNEEIIITTNNHPSALLVKIDESNYLETIELIHQIRNNKH